MRESRNMKMCPVISNLV